MSDYLLCAEDLIARGLDIISDILVAVASMIVQIGLTVALMS
jgi:hypothetical protein